MPRHALKKSPPPPELAEIRPGQSIELLKELHILTRDGRMNQDSRRKLKQVYHLVQFIEPLLEKIVQDSGSAQVVDMGAGKSYLGFILYDLFFKSRTDRSHIYGIEARSELIQKSRALAQQLQAQGVSASRICLDPGIGFGKTVQQNFALLARQAELLSLGYPLLAGWSRKSSLAAVTQTSLAQVASMDVHARMVPSVAAALLAVQNGAAVVRVHDVAQTLQALKVLAAAQAAASPSI